MLREGNGQEEEGGDYQEIRKQEEEGLYHALGEVGEGEGGEDGEGVTYAVPMKSETGGKKVEANGNPTTEMAYSTLKHN